MDHSQDDKRQYERHENEEPVMIYTSAQPDMSYYGRTYNSSEKGMYLETDADLEVGKYYVVKRLTYYDDAKGPEPYMEHCGEVRWVCEKGAEAEAARQESDSDSGVDYHYGYGLQYA